MTTPLIEIPGHAYTRDRAPYDDPIGLAQWRYRWSCSCGAAERWQTISASLAYRGWRGHLKKVRTRELSGRRENAGGGGVVNSTVHPITDPYPLRDRTFHGLGVWEMGEDGDQGVMVEGHGRRSLAALSAYGRSIYGPDWRRLERLNFTPVRIWVVIEESCGCTDEQHARHVEDAEGSEWTSFCDDCEHDGLPPCRDEYGWMTLHVPAKTPGALAMTEAQW